MTQPEQSEGVNAIVHTGTNIHTKPALKEQPKFIYDADFKLDT